MIKNALKYYKVSKLVKSRQFNYIPLDVSTKRDEEKFYLDWHDTNDNTNSHPAIRKITEDQSMLLWRLYQSSFSHPKLLFDNSSSISSMILCAFVENQFVTQIRFRFSNIEKSIVSPPNNEAYAVDLESRKIFELKEAQFSCWHSPARAITTLLTKEKWWRDWTVKDTEIAQQNQLQFCTR